MRGAVGKERVELSKGCQAWGRKNKPRKQKARIQLNRWFRVKWTKTYGEKQTAGLVRCLASRCAELTSTSRKDEGMKE